MERIINVYVMRFLITVIFLLVSDTVSALSKRKLCVTFQIINSRGDYGELASMNGTMRDCMLACGRLNNCSAMNYNTDSGVCELLPEISECYRPAPQSGYIFRHLGACVGQEPIPWGTEDEDLRVDDGERWKWSLQESVDGDYSVVAEFSRGNSRSASLAFHKGLYYPGWYADNGSGYRLITREGTQQNCASGYVLTSRNDVTYDWEAYTTGSAVPLNALQVGVWFDGQPLYLVKKNIDGREVFTYYVTGNVDVMFVMNGVVMATDVYILTQ